MSVGDTQPTTPLPEWAVAEEPAPRRRRRGWPWLIALGIVVVLGVVAWFAAEAIARDLVAQTVRDQVRERLALPADQEVDVTVAGMVIPQLLSGSLDEVTVSSDDVPVGSFEGDVTVTAFGVPLQQGVDMSGATATVTLDAAQLQSVLGTIEGFPAGTVGLEEPDVTMESNLA